MYRTVWIAASIILYLPDQVPAQGWLETDRQGPIRLADARTLWSWDGSVTKRNGLEAEPMATDRPDFTEASSTVTRGVLQVESGYTFTSDSDGVTGTTAHSIGEFLIRQGTHFDWLELRLGIVPTHERTQSAGDRQRETGLEDLYLGVKIALTLQDGPWPEMALVFQSDVPTGHALFTAGKCLPGANWLYGWDINDTFTTAGSSQLNLALDDQNRDYVELAQSWTVGCTLSEQLGAYTEWFVFLPVLSTEALAEHYWNSGITYAVSDNVQLDVRAGMGLNGPAADFFTGVGLSIRIP